MKITETPWLWPNQSAIPSNGDLAEEVFDSKITSLPEAVVREAIQNSLDARDSDIYDDVNVYFDFFTEEINNNHRMYLGDLIKLRKKANHKVSPLWEEGKLHWLTIQDTHTTGLEGDTLLRNNFNGKEAYWNYWLNWKTSNKGPGKGGGRGIGRISFLMASQISTILGFTKRKSDNKTIGCGTSIFEPNTYILDGKKLNKTQQAFLVAKESDEEKSVFELISDYKFLSSWEETFKFTKCYTDKKNNGLAVTIPYPNTRLTDVSIIAAVIEHYTPVILNKVLNVEVDENAINLDTINAHIGKKEVVNNIQSVEIKEGIGRYIDLVKNLVSEEKFKKIKLSSGNIQKAKKELLEIKKEFIKALSDKLNSNKKIFLEIEFPLIREGKSKYVSIKLVAQQTPADSKPIDRFFRRGMSLPDIKTREADNIDMIISVDDQDLSDYLNLYEGASHTGFNESDKVKNKVIESGYKDHEVKKFVANLSTIIRDFLSPDRTQKTLDVFKDIFSVQSIEEGKKRKRRKRIKPEGNQGKVPVGTIPKKPKTINIRTLKNGFELLQNADSEHESWPRNISFKVQYVSSGSSSWSKYDFEIEKLDLKYEGCQLTVEDNMVKAIDCTKSFRISLCGFDPNRELELIKIKNNKVANQDE